MDYLTWRATQELWYYALNAGLISAILVVGVSVIRIVCLIQEEIED